MIFSIHSILSNEAIARGQNIILGGFVTLFSTQTMLFSPKNWALMPIFLLPRHPLTAIGIFTRVIRTSNQERLAIMGVSADLSSGDMVEYNRRQAQR